MPKLPPNKDVQRILKDIESGDRKSLVILFIPSHTKKENEIAAQDQWADAALDLFAELYDGATAFNTYAGIYRDKVRNKDLKDKPILVECYAARSQVIDVAKLTQLVEFMKRMGRETDQVAVAVVIENTFHEITEF
jgi:hypothetical protein